MHEFEIICVLQIFPIFFFEKKNHFLFWKCPTHFIFFTFFHIGTSCFSAFRIMYGRIDIAALENISWRLLVCMVSVSPKVGHYFGGCSHSQQTSILGVCVCVLCVDSAIQCAVHFAGRMAPCVRVTCDAHGGGAADGGRAAALTHIGCAAATWLGRRRVQNGSTALIGAAADGHADCARLLLDAGADKNATDNVSATDAVCAAGALA